MAAREKGNRYGLAVQAFPMTCYSRLEPQGEALLLESARVVVSCGSKSAASPLFMAGRWLAIALF